MRGTYRYSMRDSHEDRAVLRVGPNWASSRVFNNFCSNGTNVATRIIITMRDSIGHCA